MADKGIIFSAPMVRALLDGRKSQTRRLLKDAPKGDWYCDRGAVGLRWVAAPGSPSMPCRLPYAVGERLYVREAWNTFVLSQDLEESWPTKEIPRGDPRIDNDGHHHVVVDYATMGLPGTDAGKGPWRPSIHMPRWASRLWLSVTEVRVQRVQDISNTDARCEGLERWSKDGRFVKYGIPDRDGFPGNDDLGWPWEDWCTEATDAFAFLWNNLHTKPGETWADNPWIVALTFDVHHGNIDAPTPDRSSNSTPNDRGEGR